jgi:hypothetical protein
MTAYGGLNTVAAQEAAIGDEAVSILLLRSECKKTLVGAAMSADCCYTSKLNSADYNYWHTNYDNTIKFARQIWDETDTLLSENELYRRISRAKLEIRKNTERMTKDIVEHLLQVKPKKIASNVLSAIKIYLREERIQEKFGGWLNEYDILYYEISRGIMRIFTEDNSVQDGVYIYSGEDAGRVMLALREWIESQAEGQISMPDLRLRAEQIWKKLKELPERTESELIKLGLVWPGQVTQ